MVVFYAPLGASQPWCGSSWLLLLNVNLRVLLAWLPVAWPTGGFIRLSTDGGVVVCFGLNGASVVQLARSKIVDTVVTVLWSCSRRRLLAEVLALSHASWEAVRVLTCQSARATRVACQSAADGHGFCTLGSDFLSLGL